TLSRCLVKHKVAGRNKGSLLAGRASDALPGAPSLARPANISKKTALFFSRGLDVRFGPSNVGTIRPRPGTRKSPGSREEDRMNSTPFASHRPIERPAAILTHALARAAR